jgi:hypothetical protein
VTRQHAERKLTSQHADDGTANHELAAPVVDSTPRKHSFGLTKRVADRKHAFESRWGHHSTLPPEEGSSVRPASDKLIPARCALLKRRELYSFGEHRPQRLSRRVRPIDKNRFVARRTEAGVPEVALRSYRE